VRVPVLGLVLSLLVPGCGPTDAEKPDASAEQAVRIASVGVTREKLVEPVFGTGSIAAHKTSEIGPRADGIIEEIQVSVGDRVGQGDPLFRTRQVDYRIRVREAQYALRLARAQAAKAERDLERIEQLHREGVASDERLDEVRTAHEIAVSQRGVAGTSLARARQALDDTVVTAPYAGVITRRYVDEGTMMRTMMSSGSPVVEIMKTDLVLAIVQIPGVHLPRVHVGTPARVRIDGVAREYETSVSVLNDRVDDLSRAFEVRLPIENPDLSIKPGLFARVEVLPEPRAALVVDRRAVLGPEGSRYVFVAVDGRAAHHPVHTRELDATRVEVLEGLALGDRVLAGPNLPLVADGAPVIVEVAHVDR
jgi:RND family efflux transporter MFP subunit